MSTRLRALALLSLCAGWPAGAQVFKDEPAALRSAFPGAERFDPRDVVLSDAMALKLEQVSRAKVSERMVTFYTAQKAGQVLGYAVIHSHVVRTKRETICVAFEPDGRVRKVEVATGRTYQLWNRVAPSEPWVPVGIGRPALSDTFVESKLNSKP